MILGYQILMDLMSNKKGNVKNDKNKNLFDSSKESQSDNF